ncbi:hypothetical protein [Kitasatospora sp. NPDC085464]|uniref:hypothetical protein n=1 Tax=Kitasatospora sp. NPDC085464 TaxID=3364063 RepID=UPI0037CB16BF
MAVTAFAPARQFLGIAAETNPGQPVAMTNTLTVAQIKPSDKVTYLEDKALRGVMSTEFNEILGVGKAELDINSPAFADQLPWWCRNILGDVSVTGTPTGTGATTLSVAAAAGATSFTTQATIPAGTLVQIGTGAKAEIVTTGTPTGSAPNFVIPVTVPASGGLVYAHSVGDAVTPVTGPYTYAYSLLNSGTGQPPSHTVTHYLGPGSTGARQYPGFAASELALKFAVESALLEYTVKGTSWPSVPAAVAPQAAPGTTIPLPSWSTTIGIGGSVAGSPVATVSEGEITLKRELGVIYTATGVRVPYVIQRGGLTVEGKFTFSAVADESPLLYMLTNSQPQVQIIHSNGLTGVNMLKIQIDMQQCAFTVADPDAGKTAVGYSTTFKPLLNTANAGGSGGYSQIKISITCNVPPGSF